MRFPSAYTVEGYIFLILSGTLKTEYTVQQVHNPRE